MSDTALMQARPTGRPLLRRRSAILGFAPTLAPAWLTGFALAFARGVGNTAG